jgi:hypothetical protein
MVAALEFKLTRRQLPGTRRQKRVIRDQDIANKSEPVIYSIKNFEPQKLKDYQTR